MTEASFRSLAYTSLLVPEHDAAVAFFTQVLGWAVVEDTARPSGKRRIVVRGPLQGRILHRERNWTLPDELRLVDVVVLMPVFAVGRAQALLRVPVFGECAEH
jgi:catechol 2,3-dioxygenase-like lactoylglutathione lyase family enzyme